MHLKIPPYIDKSNVIDAPLDFNWKGSLEHIGPVETVNKMFKLIGYKTTCGMLTQAAGIISWGAWRLHKHTNVIPLFQMIEASYAFQVHPHYVNRDGVAKVKPPETPPAESAIGRLRSLLRAGLNSNLYWRNYYQPFDSAYHSAYLVRHIMPRNKKKVFSDWLQEIIARIKEVAPKPDEDPIKDKGDYTPEELDAYYARHWGEALPPQILDLDFDYKHENREELVNEYLNSLNWEDNPFLRSPEQMKGLGFKGTPYQL